MKNLPILLILLLNTNLILANDGAFYAKGNQLIPISETTISIKKEILSLKKIKDERIEVTVYYEFFNPGNDKELIVGFEAFSPAGDVNASPKNGQHPYMRDFTVEMNGKMLKYDVAYVNDTTYYQNGIIKSKDLSSIESEITNENYVDFYYVYHFKTKFIKGLNIVKHTYNYDLSGSVDLHYDFEYVLTAANRWGNNQIDDFTLIMDLGEFESFNVSKSFFKDKEDWLINGRGKSKDVEGYEYGHSEEDAVKFYLQKGTLIFSKKNFKPVDELFVYTENYWGIENLEYIPFSYYQQESIGEPTDEFQKKILMNLPFARRGYIFNNKELQDFYRNMDWYMPNPNYVPDVKFLSDLEKEWIMKWKVENDE